MVYCACLSGAFVKFCVCPFFPFYIEGRMWVMIVFISDHCLSIYFFIFFAIFSNVRGSHFGLSVCEKKCNSFMRGRLLHNICPNSFRGS